jgi:hypothetical protein
MSCIDGESLTCRSLRCKNCSEATYTMETSVDGTDGNGSGGAWNMGASTMDGCNGRGGADGWRVGASTEGAWNLKDGGGGRR